MNLQTIKSMDGKIEYVLLPVAVVVAHEAGIGFRLAGAGGEHPLGKTGVRLSVGACAWFRAGQDRGEHDDSNTAAELPSASSRLVPAAFDHSSG